jgi:hypothetical protein
MSSSPWSGQHESSLGISQNEGHRPAPAPPPPGSAPDTHSRQGLAGVAFQKTFPWEFTAPVVKLAHAEASRRAVRRSAPPATATLSAMQRASRHIELFSAVALRTLQFVALRASPSNSSAHSRAKPGAEQKDAKPAAEHASEENTRSARALIVDGREL